MEIESATQIPNLGAGLRFMGIAMAQVRMRRNPGGPPWEYFKPGNGVDITAWQVSPPTSPGPTGLVMIPLISANEYVGRGNWDGSYVTYLCFA
jgi:hypothetical protein